MEPNQQLAHPSDAQLASFLDPALGVEALEALVAHLDNCPMCEGRLENIEPAFSQFRLCLEAVHSRISRSSGSERELWAKMERLESGGAPQGRMAWRIAWTSGIAATLIAFAVLILPGERGSELRAETLLARVAVATKQTTVNRRLLIRTRTVSFMRLSERHPDTAEEKAVRAHFVAAHYDWLDPLGPQSYSDWRHSLKHKTSKVFATRNALSGQPEQCIETTTGDGTLVDVSLTIDAHLLPVKGSFRFADQEWIEITTVPDPDLAASSAPAVAVSPALSAKVPAGAPSPPLAERELAVRLAIDALQIGAGEPIEVTVEPTGGILVTTYHLTTGQRSELQMGLDRVGGVTLRAADGIAGETEAVSPRLVDRSDLILHSSQDLAYEAHLLAELASRFDAAADALSASSRNKLWALRMKHAIEMNRDLATLRRELEWEPPSDPGGQPQVQRMANCASTVDRLISELYSGSDVDSDPAAMRRQLQSEFALLQNLAGAYFRYLERTRQDLP